MIGALAKQLREELQTELAYVQDALTNEQLRSKIAGKVVQATRGGQWTVTDRQTLMNRVFYSLRGMDILQPYLDDPSVTEIMINRYDEIFVEREGCLHRTDERFEDEARLEDLIQNVLGQVNRTANEGSPIADARLPDGSRVHVVLPPVALKGASMTIRKFSRQIKDMQELIGRGAIDEQASAYLRDAVINKRNIFISGGTGTGKTTFLNALAGFIPKDERIVTIEDTAELNLEALDNVVRLETRQANSEGKGEISIRDLIRASLRMRPNRIIVGEVRGAETVDMLQAMNTGHEGSLSTGHANSPRDMLSRLETMVLTGARLPVEVIRKQIGSALDVIVHLQRNAEGKRFVSEICEVCGMDRGEVQLTTVYQHAQSG